MSHQVNKNLALLLLGEEDTLRKGEGHSIQQRCDGVYDVFIMLCSYISIQECHATRWCLASMPESSVVVYSNPPQGSNFFLKNLPFCQVDTV